MMKKLLALLLCLMMMTCAAFACAESVEEMYEGVWIEIIDGPEFYIPSDWMEIEITEEYAEAGLCYAAASPDGEYTCQVYWSALEEDMEVDALLTEMLALYPDSQLLDLETAAFVCFIDTEIDALCFAALDAVEPGLYQFMFTPASDDDLCTLASAIVASIAE